MSCSETNGNFVWVSRNANPIPYTQGMGIISSVMLSCDAFVSSTSLYSGVSSILGQVAVVAPCMTLCLSYLSGGRDGRGAGDGSLGGGLVGLLSGGLGLGLRLLDGLGLLSRLVLLGSLGLLGELLGDSLGRLVLGLLGRLVSRLALALISR